jgi:hypothetical protein
MRLPKQRLDYWQRWTDITVVTLRKENKLYKKSVAITIGADTGNPDHNFITLSSLLPFTKQEVADVVKTAVMRPEFEGSHDEIEKELRENGFIVESMQCDISIEV